VDSDQKRVAFRDIERELTKKRKAVGYDDDQNATGLLYREQTDLEFFETYEPLEFLAKTNRILLSKGKFFEFFLSKFTYFLQYLKMFRRFQKRSFLLFTKKFLFGNFVVGFFLLFVIKLFVTFLGSFKQFVATDFVFFVKKNVFVRIFSKAKNSKNVEKNVSMIAKITEKYNPT